MDLDIRIPTGLLFGIIGLIMTIYGIVARDVVRIVTRDAVCDINVNFWWGLVLLVFAVVMLGLAWRASRAAK
jgi:hypothetical protein